MTLKRISNIRTTEAKRLYNDLHNHARNHGPNAKFLTVREILSSYNVKRTTTNAVLDELEEQNIIYRKDRSGIFVSPTIHHKTISLICNPHFFQEAGGSPFWLSLWTALIDRAKLRSQSKAEIVNFHVSVPTGIPDQPFQQDLMELIDTGRVDGIIAIALTLLEADYIYRRSLPFVVFAGPGTWMVTIDMEHLYRVGADELIKRGCRRIAVWYPKDQVSSVTANAEAYLRDSGLLFETTMRDGMYASYHSYGNYSQQGYFVAGDIFSREGDKPDGILIGDDMMATGVLTALQKQAVRIGEDVQIVTHANIGTQFFAGLEDVIVRVEIDPAEVALAMFEKLEAIMNGIGVETVMTVVSPVLALPNNTQALTSKETLKNN